MQLSAMRKWMMPLSHLQAYEIMHLLLVCLKVRSASFMRRSNGNAVVVDHSFPSRANALHTMGSNDAEMRMISFNSPLAAQVVQNAEVEEQVNHHRCVGELFPAQQVAISLRTTAQKLSALPYSMHATQHAIQRCP